MTWKLKLKKSQLSWKSFLPLRWKRKEKVEGVFLPQPLHHRDVTFSCVSAPTEEASLAGTEFSADELLPDELLQRIFEKLSGRSQEILRCMQVSKRWRSIMKLAVQSVYLKDDLMPGLEGVAEQLQGFENLTKLKIAIFNSRGRPWSEFFRIVGGSCRRLKQVTIFCRFPMLLAEDVASMFSHICALETVYLNGDVPLSTPLANGSPLTALESLSINDNPSLTVLPNLVEAIPGLRSLELMHCPSLQQIPDLSGLSRLSILYLENCTLVTDVPSLSAATSLQVLEIVDCTGLVSLPSLAELASLVVLKLRGCSSLSEAPGLDNLPAHMERLMVYDCPKLLHIPTASIRRLHHLKELALGYLDPLDDLPNLMSNPFDPGPSSQTPVGGSLDGLDHLQMFALDSEQERIPPLGSLPRLLHLRFRFIQASELPPTSRPPSPLLSAMLFGCTFLQSIDPLLSFSTLEQLTLMGCHSLRTLPPLVHSFPSLRDLVISDCPLLDTLPDLAGLTRLNLLVLEENDALKSVPRLSGLQSLRKLSILLCPLLQRLPPLTDLPSLLSLSVSECAKLEQLPDICLLSSLESLEVTQCPVRRIPSLSGLQHLRSVSLRGCSELSQLPSLVGLSMLQTLNLSDCIRIRTLGALDGLSALKELDLQRCTSLTDVPLLQDASESLVIKLDGCTSLRRRDQVLASGRGYVDWGNGKLVARKCSTPRESSTTREGMPSSSVVTVA